MAETNSIKKSRTRSGCLTCRDRHMKCDEGCPVCTNCMRSKRHCIRGVRLSFTRLNVFTPPSIPGNERAKQHRILDHSITVASQFKNGKSRYRKYLQQHTKEELWESDARFHHGEGLPSVSFKVRSENQSYPALQKYEGQRLGKTTRSGSYNMPAKKEKNTLASSFPPEVLADGFMSNPVSRISQKK